MYEALTDFLRTFSAGHPALWALLVMAVVICTSLFLFGFWEGVLRLLLGWRILRKSPGRRSR